MTVAKPLISVKEFGAIGDGNVNDTNAIQSTIDLVNSISGGTVFFPPGTYYCNGLTIGNNTILTSDGGVELKIKAGDSAGTSAMLTNKNYISGNSGIIIENINFDMNYLNATGATTYGLYFIGCNNSRVQGCRIRNVKDLMIVFASTSGSPDTYNNFILNNSLEQFLATSPNYLGTSVIYIGSPISGSHNYTNRLPSRAYENVIEGNLVSGGRWGINLFNASRNTIVNNTVTNNTDRNIICFATCSNNIIANNSCKQSAGAGILINIAGNYNRIENNHILDTTTTRGSGGQGVGILLEYDCEGTIINGNIIQNSSNAGIGILYGCQNTIVTSNNVSGTASGIIVRSGELIVSGSSEIPGYVVRTHTNTIVSNNLISETSSFALSTDRANTTGKVQNLLLFGNSTTGTYSISTGNTTFDLSSFQNGIQIDNNYSALGNGGNNLVIGAGGTSPNAASFCFGDGTGWKTHFGTKISGLFSPLFSFIDDGSLGIRTQSPSEKLHVSGNIRINGTGISINQSQSDPFGMTTLNGNIFRMANGASNTTPNFGVIGFGSAKAISMIAGVGGAGIVWDDSANFGFYTDTKANIQTGALGLSLALKGTFTSNGKFAIGPQAPTAYLHLPSGLSTANGSPLKFTSGTLLATPEVGAVEFDGTNLFYTTSAPTRRIFQSQNTSGTLPTATAADRGSIYHLQQGTGIADEVYICIKKADDTYDWIQIA